MPFGTGLGRVFQKKGRSSSHPIGFCGRPAGVCTPICRVRSNRGAGRSSSPPLGLRKRCGEGTSTARIYRQCFELPKKVARSFSFSLQKTFFFRWNVLKIMWINLSFVPPTLRLSRREGRKKEGKNEKRGRNRRMHPCFAGFFPVFCPASPFFFSPLRCLSFFSEIGSRGARIFKFRKAHFRRFLYICTTMSPLGDRFRPSKTTLE